MLNENTRSSFSSTFNQTNLEDRTNETHLECNFCWIACLSVVCQSFGCSAREPEAEIDQLSALEIIRTHILAEPVLFDRVEYNPAVELVAEKWTRVSNEE
jgi:hypothetical protein